MRAAEPTSEELASFALALDGLVQALWTWSPTRWTDERVEAARGLALAFVALATPAGVPPPAGAELPTVAPYGIADQLAVLGNDLLAAPHAERAAAEALSHLTAARAALG